MKPLLSPSICALLIIFSTASFSQCFPDPSFSSESYGLYPAGPMQVDCSGTNSSKTILGLTDTLSTVLLPVPTGDSLNVYFDAMRVTYVTGLPIGLILETDVLSSADSASPYGIWEYSGTQMNMTVSEGCVNISGSPSDWNTAATGGANGDGVYTIELMLDFRVDTADEPTGPIGSMFTHGAWTVSSIAGPSLTVELHVNESACLGDLSLMTEVFPSYDTLQCDGSATVEVFYGTPPYSYVFSNSSSGSASVDSLCPGIYGVQVTDALGATAVGQFAIAAGSNTYSNVISNNVIIGTDTFYAIFGTCSLDYSLPIDSFAITSVLANGPNTTVVEWVVYQQGNPFTITSLYPFFGNVGTVFSLLAWCDDGRSQAGVFQLYEYVELSVGINTPEMALDFSIYPNPSNGNVSLLSETTEELNIRVMDVSGKTVHAKKLVGSTRYTINLETVLAGVYFMEIETVRGRSFKRLVKN